MKCVECVVKNKTFPSFSMLQSIETNALGFTLQLLETLFKCASKFTWVFFLYHKFVFVSGFCFVSLAGNPLVICIHLWGQLFVRIAPRRRTQAVSSLYVVFHRPSGLLRPLLVAITGRLLLVSKVKNDAFNNKVIRRHFGAIQHIFQISVRFLALTLVDTGSNGMYSDPRLTGGAGFNQTGGHEF